MDTENSVKGLKNTEILDIKMAETLKKKKTRRGKKNHTRKSPGNTSDVFSTFHAHNLYIKRNQRNRKFIRPTSPKAPLNSTQFLIEDRGLDQIDFDNVSPIRQSPINHGLSPEIADYTNLSFYEVGNEVKQKLERDTDGDFEYMPINFEDTADFIEQEFEKDLNSHHVNCSNFLAVNTYNRKELSRLPKNTIIQQIFELEEKLRKLEKDVHHSSRDNMQTKIGELQKENSTLKSENNLLRNFLS